MKNILALAGVLAIVCFTTCSHKVKNVPEDVKSDFSSKFPDATGVKWSMENENEWEAEFKMKGVEYSANFDNTGNWIETEYEVPVSDIPATVKEVLDTEFSAYKIEESEVSETAKGKAFEFELKKRKEEVEVSIDMQGKILKKEQEKEDVEQDD